MKETKKVHISGVVPVTLRDQLLAIARREQRSLNFVLNKAIENYITEEENMEKKR